MSVTVPVGYDTDGSQLDRDMSQDASKAGSKAGKAGGESFSKGFRSLIKPLAGLGAGLAVKDFLSDSIGEAREAQKVGALTTQVIKSTGRAANVSADQVGNLATSISNKIGVDDEAIQSGENLLLTFTNIRNEAGRGNDVFNQATRATTDLAAAMAAASGGQLNFRSSATLVGKALNDPIKGLTALSRVGVAFTDQQKEQIKTLVGQGKSLQAQKIILGELTKEFGGAAASQATAADKAGVAIKNLEEQIGTALLPVIDNLADKVSKDVVPAVSEFITGMEDGTGAGGRFADSIKNDVLPVAKNLIADGKLVYSALHPVFDLLNDLPAPVKSAGITLGVLSTQVAKLTPTLDKNASAAERFGGTLRNVYGAAGLLGVVDAANRSNQALGGLEGAVGGAAAGFAVGGPLGAGLGFVGGGLLGIFSSGHKATDGLDSVTAAIGRQKSEIEGYESTLKGLQAAITGQTTENVLANIAKGREDILKDLSATDKQILNAAKGRQGALDAVSRVINAPVLAGQAAVTKQQEKLLDLNKQLAAISATGTYNEKQNATTARNNAEARLKDLQAQLDAATKLANAQDDFIAGLGVSQREARKARAEALSFTQLIKLGVPKPIAHIIDTHGVDQDIDTVAGLIDKFHILDRTKWRAILRAEGLPATDANIKRIIDDLKKVDGTIAHATVYVTPKLSDAKLAQLLKLDVPGRATGGPVSANMPYVVGERRPEVFVPDRPGRIVPSVGQYQREAGGQAAPITIIQQDFGPTTSRAKVQEMTWALTYGTRARTGAERSLVNA